MTLREKLDQLSKSIVKEVVEACSKYADDRELMERGVNDSAADMAAYIAQGLRSAVSKER